MAESSDSEASQNGVVEEEAPASPAPAVEEPPPAAEEAPAAEEMPDVTPIDLLTAAIKASTLERCQQIAPEDPNALSERDSRDIALQWLASNPVLI